MYEQEAAELNDAMDKYAIREEQEAEIAATIAELAFDYLDAPIERVTSRDVPMPVSKVLENEIVPREQDLLDAARRTIS